MAAPAPLRQKRPRVAAATSLCRISDSPIRKQRTPARAMRARSRGRGEAALAHQRCGRAGTRAASLSVVARSVFKLLRLRLLMPMSRVLRRSARPQLVARHAPRPARRGARRAAAASSVRASLVVERRQDQEDAVGAHRACFGHLIRIEHEVLAQQRQVDRGMRRVEVAERALEMGVLGQHGQARGAAAAA